MGAIIIEDDKSVAFWSHKHTQSKYEIGGKEFLSIVVLSYTFIPTI